jgi:hypothetical protein
MGGERRGMRGWWEISMGEETKKKEKVRRKKEKGKIRKYKRK